MNSKSAPLADRVRPDSLETYVGQKHLVGEGKPLFQIARSKRIHSMILWGPPGVGKTTLARILARETGRDFFELSAVSASKDEIRQIVERVRAKRNKPKDLFSALEPDDTTQTPILFLDEIHRFNKSQQDFLLPYVEDGTIILIGATTENPSFEVIPALLSRSRVYVLEALNNEEVKHIVERGSHELNILLAEDSLEMLVNFADGDARQALNLLQSASELYAKDAQTPITVDDLKNALQSKFLRYDKQAEEHYNTISAFIKSMRASSVDASLYYLARMIAGGEDPKFIARRLVIFASEDVGIADAHALDVANAVFRAVETVGLPEAQINLAHGTAYMALAPKSKHTYEAYFRALEDVNQLGALPIPLKLRNAPTKLMKDLGYGEGYERYDASELLPEKLNKKRYYFPPEQD